jgi:hypothetical protein
LVSYGVTPSVNTHQQPQRKLAIAFHQALSAWVGASTTTSPRWRAFASSSSHPRARGPRSRSARDSRQPRQARPRGSWSSPTSRPPMNICWIAAFRR